jgi:hypothetical protein
MWVDTIQSVGDSDRTKTQKKDEFVLLLQVENLFPFRPWTSDLQVFQPLDSHTCTSDFGFQIFALIKCYTIFHPAASQAVILLMSLEL